MSSTSRPGAPSPGVPNSGLSPAPVAPRQLGWAVRLLHLAAALQILVTVLSLVNISSDGFRARTREALVEMGQGGILDAVVDSAIKFSLVTAVAGGILAIVMYLLLARFIGKGAMWARLAGGVIAIGSLYQLSTLTMPVGIVTVVQILATLTAITLCYLKPASTYFREKQIQSMLRKRR